jgi:hypothetical protein
MMMVFFSDRWRHTPSFVLARRFVTILKKMMRKDEKREKRRNARDADVKATERETRGGLTTRERERTAECVCF